jgi:hypothetical protein
MDALAWPVAVIAAALVFFGVEREAAALGPVDVEIAVRGGYGVIPSAPFYDPFFLCLGGRAGASFFHAYAGASAMYYGGKYTSPSNGFNAVGIGGVHTLLYGAEFGYGFVVLGGADPSYDPYKTPWLAPPKQRWIITVRPQVGIGYRVTYFTGDLGPTPDPWNAHSLYVEPAVVGEARWGALVLGAEASLIVSPGMRPYLPYTHEDRVAWTFHLLAGVAF